MLNQFSRTQLLYGEAALEKLQNSRVAVFGVGGVGGYVCEALVRSGVGCFDLVDDDKVCLTNLNRQIIATRKTVGKYKTEVMKERMLEINPQVKVNIHDCFFLPENADDFPFEEYDYVVDAVDTVTAKIEIILRAQEKGVPVISAMGAGNKLDASRFKVDDIYKTKVCPLAKVMRRELKRRGVKKLKVVYSDEKPTRPLEDMSISCRTHCICPPGAKHKCTERRDIPGSNAFVPAVAGLIIAGEVVNDLTAMVPKYANAYRALAHNVVDQIVEQQAKIGYVKEKVRLYYPLSSMNNFFNTAMKADNMQQALSDFPTYMKKVYGEVKVSHDKDRFCICASEKVSEYIHNHMDAKPFIVELVELIGNHDCTMEQVFGLFNEQEIPCEIEQVDKGDFDYLIHFADGDDRYYYCFKEEMGHVTYHRVLPEDM